DRCRACALAAAVASRPRTGRALCMEPVVDLACAQPGVWLSLRSSGAGPALEPLGRLPLLGAAVRVRHARCGPGAAFHRDRLRYFGAADALLDQLREQRQSQSRGPARLAG